MRVRKTLDLLIRFSDEDADEVKAAHEQLRRRYRYKDIYLRGLHELLAEEEEKIKTGALHELKRTMRALPK
jgi:hypothetical protein